MPENIVAGRNSVRELLKSGRSVDKLFVRTGDREGSITVIVAEAIRLGIPVIEVDGSQHYEPQGIAYDTERSQFLTALGLEVLRFSNRDIDRDFRGVCEQIDITIQSRLQGPLSHLR